MQPLRLVPLAGLPAISAGDDLAALIAEAARAQGLALRDGVLVVAQKVVSKAEGRTVAFADVEPSARAREIARRDGKDPRHAEIVLRETVRIVRRGHGVMICETAHGFVCANAGVDLSNAPGRDVAVLLPVEGVAPATEARGASGLTQYHVPGEDALEVHGFAAQDTPAAAAAQEQILGFVTSVWSGAPLISVPSGCAAASCDFTR